MWRKRCCNQCATLYRVSSIAGGATPQIVWRRDYFQNSLPNPPGNNWAGALTTSLFCGLDANGNCYHGGFSDNQAGTGPWWKKYDPAGNALWTWTPPAFSPRLTHLWTAFVTASGYSVLQIQTSGGDTALFVLDTNGNIIAQTTSVLGLLAASAPFVAAAVAGFGSAALSGAIVHPVCSATDNYIAIQLVPGGTSRQSIVVLDTTSLNYAYLVGDGIGPSQYGPTDQVSVTGALLEPGGLSNWLVAGLASTRSGLNFVNGLVLAIDLNTPPTLHGGAGVTYPLHWSNLTVGGAPTPSSLISDGSVLVVSGPGTFAGASSQAKAMLQLSSGATIGTMSGNWGGDALWLSKGTVGAAGEFNASIVAEQGVFFQVPSLVPSLSGWKRFTLPSSNAIFFDAVVDDDGGSLWSGQEGCGVAIVPA